MTDSSRRNAAMHTCKTTRIASSRSSRSTASPKAEDRHLENSPGPEVMTMGPSRAKYRAVYWPPSGWRLREPTRRRGEARPRRDEHDQGDRACFGGCDGDDGLAPKIVCTRRQLSGHNDFVSGNERND